MGQERLDVAGVERGAAARQTVSLALRTAVELLGTRASWESSSVEIDGPSRGGANIGGTPRLI